MGEEPARNKQRGLCWKAINTTPSFPEDANDKHARARCEKDQTLLAFPIKGAKVTTKENWRRLRCVKIELVDT